MLALLGIYKAKASSVSGDPKSVKVGYSFVDGAHFFVGKDVNTLGLCVAHPKMEVAYHEAQAVLEKLYYLNNGSKKKFVMAMPFEQFAKWASTVNSPPTPQIKVQKMVSDVTFEMAEAA
ncbi:hypothetical protein [Bradyrhizobium sp. 6(2017)]|uniref:hypothetical protein n=1 Tax=Bradyrhizobium sp. 6(2017) TaxID=1197460 RepID=UPI0013E16003|nr:hypothetical protein [Bradyrhizobium sp. 6(2017)]QIG92456.1 hypothetical protein G6P99_08010 [Bradyrhizobium sp. 6(2017)]